MPQFALIGTYPLPSFARATLTAGTEHVARVLADIFRNGPVPLIEDIETYGVGADAGPGRIKCVTLATAEAAVVLNPREPGDRAEILRAQDYASALVMHKANFDAPSLAINGLFPTQLVDKIIDTLLLARLATPGITPAKDLDSCVERYLGIKNAPIMDLFRSLGYKTKRDGFLNLDIDAPAYLFGAAADGVGTARLWPVIHQAAVDRQLNHPFSADIGLSRAEAEQMIAERHEHNRWSIEQTIHGLLVDFDFLDTYRTTNQASMDQATTYLAGLGITNANQLTRFLEQIGAIPADYPRTPKGQQWSSKADDLELLHHPLAKIWGELQLKTKLDGYLQKCVDMADASGRIHPVTDVLKAAHGRDAMADPPLHQFPGPARGIILADTSFTSVDYSQQEPRIGMNLAGDLKPLEPYELLGVKIYQGIADHADISIDWAKIVVLAGLYGRGLAAMSAQLGLSPEPWIPEEVWSNGVTREARWGYEAAKGIQQAVFSAMPATADFMESGKRIARDHKVAYTVAGRIVPIPSGFYRGKFSVQAHKWINYCVSGSANDELSALVVNARRAGLGMAVRFGMHDEVLVESEAAHDIQRLAERPTERFRKLSRRTPVIRTDIKTLGKAWSKA